MAGMYFPAYRFTGDEKGAPAVLLMAAQKLLKGENKIIGAD